MVQKIDTKRTLEITMNNTLQHYCFLMNKKTFFERQLLSIYFFLFGVTSIFIDIYNTQQTIYPIGIFLLFGIFDIICAKEAYEHINNGFADLDFYRESPSYRDITIVKRTFILYVVTNYFSLDGSSSVVDKIFLLFHFPEMCVMVLEIGFLLCDVVLMVWNWIKR